MVNDANESTPLTRSSSAASVGVPPASHVPSEVLAIASLHINEALSPDPSNATTLRTFFLPQFQSAQTESTLNRLRRNAYILRSTYTLPLRPTLISLLLLLTFLENPAWCHDDCNHLFSRTSPSPTEPGTMIQTYPSYPPLAPSITHHLPWLELLINLYLLLDLLLHAVYTSNPTPLSLFYARGFFAASPAGQSSVPLPPKARRRTPVLAMPPLTTKINKLMLGYVLSLAIAIALPCGNQRYERIARPYVRMAVFLTSNKTAFRELKLIGRLMPEIAKILSLEVIILFVYAVFGCVLFSNKTVEGSLYFNNVGSSMWSLWILLTTANFPNVAMEVYGKNAADRVSILYFGSYLVLAFFLMANLLLAAVYSNYMKESAQYRLKVERNSASNLKAAFTVLDVDVVGSVGRDDMVRLFQELNTFCPNVEFVTEEVIGLCLAVLDRDGDERIELDEFKNFVRVLQVKFEREEEDAEGGSGWIKAIAPYVHSGWFEYGIDAVLGINVAVIVWQNRHDLMGDSMSGVATEYSFYEVLDGMFLAVYVMEVVVRVNVVGWKRYYGQLRFRFDFWVTALSCVATLYYWVPNSFHSKDVVQIIMMVRLLRLVRLVMMIEAYSVIGATLAQIVPICGRVFLVLFVVMYLFATTGVFMYGGAINLDENSVYWSRLQGTEYADNDFFANNFNDMFSAMVLLFELLVVNNWTISCDGFVAATASEWTRVFFVLFDVIAVLIINNLVVSFIVDTFSNEYEAEIERREGGEEEEVGLEFDASRLGGGEVSGIWRATVKTKTSKKRKESILASLFKNGEQK